LGLAIARTMVEANGGRLHLANGADGGARVTLTLGAIVRSTEVPVPQPG